ncbi:transmembrane protein 216 isoform X6 [Choloepus didactylus]|uniref:transmembrane protein 216 isoform X6 n=1 Tax=Choloepus didactylus TaxID=27675 RepID=UPI00189FE5A7|nr:transmembrane protein 216 isoform X6 [Choloepus didactylus]
MAPRGEVLEVCKRLSSTPLEILFFLNGWYYATYFLLELFIFLYKGLLLPYPTANLVLDVVMLLLYLGIEVIRLFFDHQLPIYFPLRPGKAGHLEATPKAVSDRYKGKPLPTKDATWY